MDGQKVLVVGATGLIGFYLAKELARDNTVYGVARFEHRAQDDVARHNIIPVPFDVTEGDFGSLPADVDYVFNEVMLYSEDDFPQSIAVNAFPTARLFERYRHTKGIVLGSTGSVYRLGVEPADENSPLDGRMPYSLSKICSEMFGEYFSREYDVPACILRYYQPYCETGGFLKSFLDSIVAGKSLMRADIHMAPVHMSDVVAMTIRAADHCTSPPTVINVSGDQIIPKRQLVERMADMLGRQPVFDEDDPKPPYVVASTNTKRKQLLGEQKVSLAEGARRVCDAYLQSHPPGT